LRSVWTRLRSREQPVDDAGHARLRSLFVVVAVISLAATPSFAESRAKLFPLSSTKLPQSMTAAPDELSRVLARSFDAELTTVPIEDAAQLLECSLTQVACLEAIAHSVSAPTIVFGRLEITDDGAVIDVTWFDQGDNKKKTKTFTLTGESIDELESSLRDALDPKPAPVIETPPIAQTETATGHPTTGTWTLIIAGGVTAGAGLAFLASANGLRGDVNRAPTATHEDIDRLVALENAGRKRMQIGGALLAIGGVVGTIGIIRAVIQKRSGEERPLVDIVPEVGGASVRLTVGFR